MDRVLSKLRKIVTKVVIRIVLLISRGASVEFLLFRGIARLPLLVLFRLLGDETYALISFAEKNKNRFKKKKGPSQASLRLFVTRVLMGDKSTTFESYCDILFKTSPPAKVRYELAHRFMAAGRLDLAKITVLDLIDSKLNAFSIEEQLKIYRSAGTIFFMMGQNKEANDYWKSAGQLRKSLFKPTTPTKYRILGSSWFVAVGHVAMLDYYLKYKRLYGQENHRIVAMSSKDLGCTADLMRKFSELGILVLGFNEREVKQDIPILGSSALESDYDRWAEKNNAPQWKQLSLGEKNALIDDFWEHEFPDGEILSYTRAAARIQNDWEQAGNPPLFAVTPAERKWLDAFLVRLGVPVDAWYVCIHVREAGFHQQWNSKLPAMRDSEIDDYYSAIQTIVAAGGWVLRMGDPSMKMIPAMRNVVDYAHSSHRESFADMLLAATCRFFLGTNSGFATIPAIYGIPCALSNWVPIGWPLWPRQDLMICKLFRDKSTQKFLSLEEMFKRGLVFLQNWSDLPSDVELVANTPEDIRQLTVEMLSCFGPNKRSIKEIGAPAEVQNNYANLANRYETFASSRFAGSFVKSHPEVFMLGGQDNKKTQEGDIQKWQQQLNANTVDM